MRMRRDRERKRDRRDESDDFLRSGYITGEERRGKTRRGGGMLVLIFRPAGTVQAFTSAPCLSRPLSYSARHTRVSCSR